MSKEGKQTKDDAFAYWKQKLGNAQPNGKNSSSDEELSGSGFEGVEQEMDFEDDSGSFEQSHELAQDDDFILSASLKKSQKKFDATSAASLTPAQEKLRKLKEDQQREERDAKIKAKIEEEMRKVNSLVDDSSDSDSEKLSKTPIPALNDPMRKPGSSQNKPKTADSNKDTYKNFMAKQGKKVSSSEEISDESEHEAPKHDSRTVSGMSHSIGSGLVQPNPSNFIPMKVKNPKPNAAVKTSSSEPQKQDSSSSKSDEVFEEEVIEEYDEEEFTVHSANSRTAAPSSIVNMASVVPQKTNLNPKQGNEMRQIEKDLAEIKPRYSPQRQPGSKPRPATAKTAKPWENQKAAKTDKNADLVKEKVMPRTNNFVEPRNQFTQDAKLSTNPPVKRNQKPQESSSSRAKAYAESNSACNLQFHSASRKQSAPKPSKAESTFPIRMSSAQQESEQKLPDCPTGTKTYAFGATKPSQAEVSKNKLPTIPPVPALRATTRTEKQAPKPPSKPKALKLEADEIDVSMDSFDQIVDETQKQATKTAFTTAKRPASAKSAVSEVPKPKPSIPSHKVPAKKPVEKDEPTEPTVKHTRTGLTNLVLNNQPTFKAQKTDDFTNDLAKNKKFQAVKSMKEAMDRKKEAVMKDLEKVGLVKTKAPVQSESAKQLEIEKKKVLTQKKALPKAVQSKLNKDIAIVENQFGSEEIIGGDEGAFNELDFGEANLLGGDEAQNFCQEEEAETPLMEMKDSEQIEVEQFEQDDVKDNLEDEEFLEEAVQREPGWGHSAPKRLQKDSAAVNLKVKAKLKVEVDKKQFNPEDFVQIRNPQSKQAPSSNGQQTSLQTQPQSKVTAVQNKTGKPPLKAVNENGLEKPDAALLPKKESPWGFNGSVKPKVDKEELERKQKEAQEKFAQLQEEKKAKEQNKNPELGAYLQSMKEIDKKKAEEAKQGTLSKATRDFQIKQPPAPTNSEPPIDLGLSKEAADLTLAFKQMYFENRQMQRNIAQTETTKRKAEITREGLLKEKNLVRSGNKLIAMPEPRGALARAIRSADVPDYDKIKARDNPLDSIVQKIEAKFGSVEDAFEAFDGDGDEVLTKAEIKNGMDVHDVYLLDTEWEELVKAMDKNGDGVLTLAEWQQCLVPRVDAQKQYIEILKTVGGQLDISDPIEFEVLILDHLFRKRRLQKEIKVMKKQRGTEDFFRKKKVESERIAVTEKIKELEKEVRDQALKQEEDRQGFEQKMKAGNNTMADITAEIEMLKLSQQEVEIEYNERLEEHRKELFTYDQRYNSINETATFVKNDRAQKKIRLAYLQKKLEAERNHEAQLDEEILKILGRAVTMADLEALYAIDLKLLNQIERGIENKIGSLKSIIAARWVQNRWREHIARKKNNLEKFISRRYKRAVCRLIRGKQDEHRLQAAILIQRCYRRLCARRNEVERLRKRNEARRQRDDQEKISANYHIAQKIAARKIARAWRQKKAYLGLKGDSPVKNPFEGKHRLTKLSDTIGVVNLAEVQKCVDCRKSTATRVCQACDDSSFCDNCFKMLHMHGHRKRHTYLRIVYPGQTQGGLDAVHLRDDTFAKDRQQSKKGSNQNTQDDFERASPPQKKSVSFV